MSGRLQIIKEKVNFAEWYEGYYLSASDIEWLIEQAEQLEKLQEQTLYSDFINRINELEEEIKHLKESRKENRSGSQHETHPVLDRRVE